MATLLELLERVSPILDTVSAAQIESEGARVADTYTAHAARYFPTDAVRKLSDDLRRKTEGATSALGYLTGEYGYGKTAAAIYLWQEATQNGFICPPPFRFESFDGLCAGVYHAVCQTLAGRDAGDTRPLLDSVYAKYRDKSHAGRAEQIARDQNIATETARAIVENYLAPSVSVGDPAFVADFLCAAADAACAAGYKGLILLADETQNFLQSGVMEANVADLRRLIFALRGREKPLGVMFVMHEQIAMRVADIAGDALHRLADSGVSLNLTRHVASDFASVLLTHLCKTASDAPKPDSLTDATTLVALGQIGARRDLSSGPRTVAVALRRMAEHHKETGKRYDCLQLMDDYAERRIVFEGQHHKISGVLTALLAHPVVSEDKSYARLIRFLAAFPEGVAEKEIKAYGLKPALEYLAEKRGFLGTEIYTPRDGLYALVKLQVEANGEAMLVQILRDFRDKWWQGVAQNAETRARTTREAFTRLLLPELFPKRGAGDAYRKFGGHITSVAALSGRDPEVVLLTGSFENTASEFPDRRVAVAVGTDAEALTTWDEWSHEAHVAFAFHLTTDDPATAHQVQSAFSAPRITWRLNTNVPIGEAFPPELSRLSTVLLPSSCTAETLLHLLYYLDDVLAGNRLSLSDRDRSEVETHLYKGARRALETLLFAADTPAQGIALRGRGRARIENLFVDKLRERFANYVALTGADTRILLERYQALLRDGNLRLPQKRGQATFEMAKDEFSRLLGINVAAHDAQTDLLRKFGLLTRRELVSRDRVKWFEYRLCEHPLEILLREQIEAQGTMVLVRRSGRDQETKALPEAGLFSLARRSGYLEPEIRSVLAIAMRRQTLEVSAQGQVLLAVVDTDPDLLAREADILRMAFSRLAAINAGAGASLLESLAQQEASIEAGRNGQSERLADVGAELRVLSGVYAERLRSLSAGIHDEMRRVAERLQTRYRSHLAAPMATPVALSTTIGVQLEGIRERWNKDKERIQKVCESVFEIGFASAPVPVTTIEALEARIAARDALKAQVITAEEKLNGLDDAARAFEAWRTFAHDAAREDAAWREAYPDLRESLRNLSDDVFVGFREEGGGQLPSLDRYKPLFDALVRTATTRREVAQSDYEAFTEKVNDALSTVAQTQRVRVPVFAVADAGSGAYQHFAEDAARVLTTRLLSLANEADALRSRLRFLNRFRGTLIETLIAELDNLQKAIATSCADATPDAVLAARTGTGRWDAALGAAKQIGESVARIRSVVKREEKPTPVLPGAASSLLEKIPEQASVSLADLVYASESDNATGQPTDPAALWAHLRELFAGGNIDVVIKRP